MARFDEYAAPTCLHGSGISCLGRNSEDPIAMCFPTPPTLKTDENTLLTQKQCRISLHHMGREATAVGKLHAANLVGGEVHTPGPHVWRGAWETIARTDR